MFNLNHSLFQTEINYLIKTINLHGYELLGLVISKNNNVSRNGIYAVISKRPENIAGDSVELTMEGVSLVLKTSTNKLVNIPDIVLDYDIMKDFYKSMVSLYNSFDGDDSIFLHRC